MIGNTKQVLLIAITAAAMLLAASGCNSNRSRASTSPYTAQAEGVRDTARAERLCREASEYIGTDAEKAESILREALAADLYHGPSHNNLGVVFLQQGKLYDAAGEFEWARKLMPGHPDPRMNLALVFESAGHTDDALAGYATALEVYPEHLPTIQALTRLQVRSGRQDDRTSEYLKTVAFRGENPEWRDWARLQLAKMDR